MCIRDSALRPAACGTDSGSHTGKPSQNRTSVRKKAAGFPAAFRFLSEPLREHKSRASFPSVRAELRPGSAWALRAAIPWRSPELSGYAIVFIPYYGFWSVLIRVMPQNTQKSGGIKPPLFAFYQNHSAGTNPGHHFPLCARTASGLSPVRPCRLLRPS